jgi:NADP-dependent 3-hydroxy acid dehydrogenase YdfG
LNFVCDRDRRSPTSSGIGEATIKLLMARGARVVEPVLADRTG